MTDYDPAAYGARIADEYDEIYEEAFDTEGAVACVAELAARGALLELGVGTGRLALPLRERGIEVHGVDASPDMLQRLAAKPGGADMAVTVGDFAQVSVPGEFSLVLLAVHTIFALPSQDAQVRCFENAARHLGPGGRFVVEAWLPDLTQFAHGPSVRPRAVGGQRVALVVAEHDPVGQRMTTTQVHLSDRGVRLHPANHRYAWPAELDLMARLAGFGLEHRWEDWRRRRFTATSSAHVSVYRLT
jgi:SAM-dependent methyltransferase